MKKLTIILGIFIGLIVVGVLFFFGNKLTGNVTLSDSTNDYSIKQTDIYLSTSWNTDWGAGIDCTNAKNYGVEEQSIEIYYTTKGDYDCDYFVDSKPVSLSSYNTPKLFSVFESHKVEICCSDNSGSEMCKNEIRSSFC